MQTLSRYVSSEFDRLYATADAVAVQEVVMVQIRNRLCTLASELGCRLQDLASTFLVAAVKDTRYLLLHLGDGLIAYRKQGKVLVASAPANGQYANSTIFTTTSHASRSIRLFKGELGLIDGFVLMSDGCCASLYNKKAATLAPVLGWLMQLCTYLPSEVVELGLFEDLQNEVRYTTADDCSLAMLARRDPNFADVASLPQYLQARLFALPSFAASTRHRVRVYVRILELLKHPLHLRLMVKSVHLKLARLRKKVAVLQACRMVERLADGRFVSKIRL